MEKIKFALIGCGKIGIRHAEHIIKNGELSAVCDIVEERANDVAAKYNTRACYTIEEVLALHPKPDVVAVCTPNGLHATHTIQSLKAGCHVLCEKPMAIQTKDCEQMIYESTKAGKLLFAIKQNRYNPPVAAVKKMLNENRLGKIYSMQLSCFWNRNEQYYQHAWHGSKELDGGTLFTQFSHFIDLLYWFFGDVDDIACYTKNFAHCNQIDFEDTGVAILRFSSGALCTINYTVNSYEKNMEGSLTIFAEKGTVKIGGEYLNKLEYQNIKDYLIKDLEIGNNPNDYGSYKGSMSNHDKVYENVINVLVNGAAMSTSSFEALKTIEIIERIYAAANGSTSLIKQ